MDTRGSSPAAAPLHSFVQRALQELLNRLLALDPGAAAELRALEGQTVTLRLDGPGIELGATVRDGHLRLHASDPAAGLRLRTTPGVVVALFLDRDYAPAPGRLEIAGDAALARHLERLVRHWRPDFTRLLAPRRRARGEVSLLDMVDQGLAAVRDGFDEVQAQVATRLHGGDQAESPARRAVADWLAGVEAVLQRTERLAARIDSLERRR